MTRYIKYSSNDISLHSRHSEFTHIWGLAGNIYMYLGKDYPSPPPVKIDNTGWFSKESFASYHKRIQKIKSYLSFIPTNAELNMHIVDHQESSVTDYIKCLKDLAELKLNKMLTVAITTQTHHSTINVIKTQYGYDVIYVNRGNKAYMDNKENLQVYYFKDLKEVINLLHVSRYVKLGSNSDEQMHSIANILNKPTWQNNFDQETSTILCKSIQKVGNCTVSNSNIVWHLMLALKQVQSGKADSYIDGYLQTAEKYRLMRIYDRAIALASFIDTRHDYQLSSYQAILITVVVKSQNKGQQFARDLITALEKINPNLLSILSRDIKFILNNNIQERCADKNGVFNSVFIKTLHNQIINSSMTINHAANLINEFKQQLSQNKYKSKPRLSYGTSVKSTYTRQYKPSTSTSLHYRITTASSNPALKLPELR